MWTLRRKEKQLFYLWLWCKCLIMSGHEKEIFLIFFLSLELVHWLIHSLLLSYFMIRYTLWDKLKKDFSLSLSSPPLLYSQIPDFVFVFFALFRRDQWINFLSMLFKLNKFFPYAKRFFVFYSKALLFLNKYWTRFMKKFIVFGFNRNLWKYTMNGNPTRFSTLLN